MNLILPGVEINEISKNFIKRNSTLSTACFVGFLGGTLNTPTLLTSVEDLVNNFELTSSNYNDWFQCYCYLFNASSLYVTSIDHINNLEGEYSKYIDRKYNIDIIISNEANNNLANVLATTRGDCIAYIGTPKDMSIEEMITFRESINSTYSMIVGNYIRMYDRYNEKNVWVNCAGYIAGLRAKRNVTHIWGSEAGLNYGVVKLANKLNNTYTLTEREYLYTNGINILNNIHNFIYLHTNILSVHKDGNNDIKFSNVRTLVNYVGKVLVEHIGNELSVNDASTRNSVEVLLNSLLRGIKAEKGLLDFNVVCSKSNNKTDTLLVVDINLRPMQSIHYIQLNFIISMKI